MSNEQRQFWQWVTRPRDLSEDADAIAELLAPHRLLSPTQALSIYNNAYHQRLVDVSSAVLPVLYNSLGKELYTKVVITYLQEFPPRNGPINRIGDSLANFLLLKPEFKNIPAAADIARLETLLSQLFDCADETSFHLGALYALPSEEWAAMTWRPKQDWALMHSRFALEEYWQKMQAFIAEQGEAGNADFGINLLPETPERDAPNYLIYRKDHTMQFQHIKPTLSVFLLLVSQELTFAQICSELAKRFPDEDTPALSLSLLLKSIEMGLLRGPRKT